MPFDFVLPPSLPSSMRFPKTSSTRVFNGRIMYFLRAEMGEFCFEKEFEVMSVPLPTDLVPCLVEPTTYELRSLGILNRGLFSMGANVENSRVGRGGTLRVSVASRNDTSVDLTRVRVKLVELIEYKARTDKATLKSDLEKLKDIDLPGVNRTKAPKEQVRRSTSGRNRQDRTSVYHSIYEDLASRNNRFDIVVPKQARDSYNGSLITISHYLKITFFTKSLAENPSTKIPIVIGNARDREQNQPFVLPGHQPGEPIAATVVFDEEISDNETIVSEFIPMVVAYILDPAATGSETPEQRPSRPNDATILMSSHPILDPTAPTESMILENDMENIMGDESPTGRLVNSDLSPPRRSRLGDVGAPSSPQRHAGYSPFQMYNGPSSPAHNMGRQRLPSYSYDTESDITAMSDRPQRLGAAYPYSDAELHDLYYRS